MGRIRRGGYIFEWWRGDHAPRHVHVSNARGQLLGRVSLADKKPLDAWHPSPKVLEIIAEMQKEGRL